MTGIQNRSPFQVALVVRPPLTGVVALALAHIRAVPIEMQIADVGRAGCDFAVLDEAVADGGLRDAIAEMNKSNKPVLVLVRNHGMMGALNAIGLGATEILRVPFDPTELVIRASQAIHRATGRMPELDGGVKIGKLDVNIGSGHIALNGSAPHLTPLERGLLYVLIANAGRVVSREDIIDCVWGADAEPNSNLVDRHIRDLRRKLQDDWRRPNVLATMRGQGYMVPITD
ncbi:MAG TPA: response regulator transcription factor [Candidatus Limnocylindria bacterium]|jgi:DNA-binding response OmpR family regulator|nr:response regulator transcription factor [Candidatus Limnocylindria bacterium]